jgi:CRP-like cAMP-binding protein
MNRDAVLDLSEKIAIFQASICFNGLSRSIICEMADKSHALCFSKGDTIFQAYDTKFSFYLVASGLVRVSICSTTGHRLTYLLAVRGDPLNLVGVFSNKPRLMEAEALQYSEILRLRRSDFVALTEKYHSIMPRIITVLGNAVDSANSRVLDMVGKTVDQRMKRILHTLYLKFGPELSFTSAEIAEMICTTTESSIRSLSKLRRTGIIQTYRGKISILKPEALISSDDDTIWI